jgi:hypothetical protein
MSDSNDSVPENTQATGETGTNAAAPERRADSATQASATDGPAREAALHDAFMLGWAIVELKSRLETALIKTSGSGLRLASVWRASFNRIAALQLRAFPECSTAQTLYEPPGKTDLPYLYAPEPDYANVGIVGTDKEGPILKDFGLYEVTRRAINCLTLLYVKEDESLIPDVIRKNQNHLVAAILEAGENTGAGGGDTQAAEDPAAPHDEAAQTPEMKMEQAKKVLTERTGKFLDAWDGYLRENYYTGGSVPNDDLELVAYEAGHSMSSLSWGIGTATASLEQQADEAPEKEEKLSDELVKKWQSIFQNKDVVRLQHQITALSSALDDAFYLRPGQKRPADDALLVAPNPDLPSQAIQAVKHSLDYWQNTVKWLAKSGNLQTRRPDAPPWSKTMRMALNEQANIWQTLMTGQQSLRAYNMESLTHSIMKDITSQIQKGLRSGFGENVQAAEKVMADLADEAKHAIVAAKNTALSGLQEIFGSSRKYLWVGVGVIVVVAVLLLSIAVINGGNSTLSSASGGVGLSSVITAILGYVGLGQLQKVKTSQQAAVAAKHENAEAKVDNQSAQAAGAGAGAGNLLSRLEGAAEQTGTMIMRALKQGYEQARIELDGLNRSVAVAYPLVEFFGLTFKLESDVSFLTEIIWSPMERDEEITRVTRAAFGPLAVFITTDDSSD